MGVLQLVPCRYQGMTVPQSLCGKSPWNGYSNTRDLKLKNAWHMSGAVRSWWPLWLERNGLGGEKEEFKVIEMGRRAGGREF